MTTSIDGSIERSLVIEEATTFLARTPATLDALLRGLPASWILANEGGQTWSAFDILGHLIHVERTDWLPRIRIILRHGTHRPFDAFDLSAHYAASRGRTLPDLLDDFARLRQANLRELAALELTPEDLDRQGRHPRLGTVTLRQLLATCVAHDLDHVMQLARVLARGYAKEVGPWRVTLRVISGLQG